MMHNGYMHPNRKLLDDPVENDKPLETTATVLVDPMIRPHASATMCHQLVRLPLPIPSSVHPPVSMIPSTVHRHHVMIPAVPSSPLLPLPSSPAHIHHYRHSHRCHRASTCPPQPSQFFPFLFFCSRSP